MPFFYVFILTLLNSIWQSAVLVLLYKIINAFYKNIHPLQKRNLLFFTLSIQIVLSAFTFYCLKYEMPWSNSITIHANWFHSFIKEKGNILYYTYVAIVVLKIGTIGFQWSSFYFSYKKYTAKPSASLRVYTSSHAALMGITRRITLFYSTVVSTPITFGFFKPVILLPFALCSQLHTKDIEAIILHELAHIKNNDYLLNWLLVFIELLFACNPFVHIIIRNIKLEREKNCDTTVIHFKYDSLSYAEALLHIAKNTSTIKNFQIAFAKSGEQLFQRITFFCNPVNFNFNKKYRLYNAILMLPLLLVFSIPNLQKEVASIKNNNSMLTKNEQPLTKKYAAIKEKIIIENSTAEMPAIKEISKLKLDTEAVVEKVYFEAVDTGNFKFASLIDTIQNTKEFIYRVETQNGKITNTYDLKFVNGKWILIPTYLIIQKYKDSNYMLQIDSNYALIDSLIQ